MKRGLQHVIGDGSLINAWTYPWLPDNLSRPPRARTEQQTDYKVNDFFLPGSNRWYEAKVREVIIDEDVEKILQIKLSPHAQMDLIGWHYNENGVYSVKSGCWLSTDMTSAVDIQPIPGNNNIKFKVWKSKAPPKLKHFLWKLISKGLATGRNLKRRHMVQDDQCGRCCQHT